MSKVKVDISSLEYKDMFGRDIKVGDYIVYAGLADRSGVLRAGQVIELTYKKTDESNYNRDTGKWIDEPEIQPKVRCKSWNNFRAQGFSHHNYEYEPSGRQKDVVLGFLDRLIVVPESQVSAKIRTDLAGPVCDYLGKPI